MTDQAYRDLRQWLSHLSASDRLALAKPGMALRHEVAALALIDKRRTEAPLRSRESEQFNLQESTPARDRSAGIDLAKNLRSR